mmetsp:Transcript_62323/g.120088  ORF Transcript_62323/g.120088 Transcript_62323/m.120088 type:complete len:178 (+) Transcript_62323:2-535(+)
MRVHRESSQLCLCDSVADNSNDNAENVEGKVSRKGVYHRAPASRWNSRSSKRAIRRSAASFYNNGTEKSADAVFEDLDAFAASVADSHSDLVDDLVIENVDALAQCWSPWEFLRCESCSASMVSCSVKMSSATPQARDGTQGDERRTATPMTRTSMSKWGAAAEGGLCCSCKVRTNI